MGRVARVGGPRLRAFFFLLSSFLVVGCGAKVVESSPSGAGGGARDGGAGQGAAGASGAGQGGTAGAAGSAAGASVGAGGTGQGAGGATGGTGGSRGGAAGGTGVGPECTTANDCKLLSDCCTCEAVAPGEAVPTCPPIACLVNQCEAHALLPNRVACVAGRCVAGFECDSSKVICKSLPPTCDAGFIPAVKDGCYAGGCVPVTECISVRSCLDCKGRSTCAAYVERSGSVPHCVTVPDACRVRTCECVGPSVCTGAFSSCGDLSGLPGVACSCPTCS
jgi:hypothetical protein